MADDKTQFWIWGAIITAITGLYAFFIKHVVAHVRADDNRRNAADIASLKKAVQYRDNCEQIVKRFDDNHSETCRRLDVIETEEKSNSQKLDTIIGQLNKKSEI